MNSYRLIHRVVPYQYEDVFGFLTRVAVRNHVSGLEALLFTLLGKQHSSVLITNLPRLAEYCRNQPEELLTLSGIEQRHSNGSRLWKVNDDWITKSTFISSRHAKICPQCLHVSPHIRGLWSLSLYTSCAWHGCALVDSCPACHRTLKWNRRHVCQCFCGFDFRLATSPSSSTGSSLIARLIAHQTDTSISLATDLLSNIETERLAKLSLDGLCKTIWFLGHCLGELGSFGAGHGCVRPRIDDAEKIITNAIALINRWPTRLIDHLNNCSRRPPMGTAGTLMNRLLGPAQHYLAEELQTDELTFVRAVYEQQLLAIWRTFGRPHQLRKLDRQLELDLGEW